MRLRRTPMQDFKTYLFGMIFVIWFALLIAPYSDTIFTVMNNINVINRPFNITICPKTLQSIKMFTSIYTLIFVIYIARRKNYRPGEEYGAEQWGNVREIVRRYASNYPDDNKILSEGFQISYNKVYDHRRNLLTLVIGGSGAGKTRFYAMPNVLQANTSFVILDPKGEILRNTGEVLKNAGYVIKILDLCYMEYSYGYNPFVYIRNDDDMVKLATNVFNSTVTKNTNRMSQDPMWEEQAQNELLAYMYYLWYEAPPEEQNFEMIMDMIRDDGVKDDDDSWVSPVGELFKELEQKNPDHIAVRYYKLYRRGAARTLLSIQATLIPRLRKFELDSMRNITRYDEMELPKMGERKTALFCIIPDNDTSFNFLVSILYTQLMQQLFDLADDKYGGRLPVHVHFLMDEFANVALPEDFDKLVSVMRSRNISVSIIVQAMSQLKALYEKQWETIVGNCDELLYLGGNEKSTHEYISQLLGKETIDTNTYSRNYSAQGSSSRNDQKTGLELMTPSQVRRMPDDDCILFIRGEKPIYDKKYDLKKHRRYAYTPFKHGQVYEHKKITRKHVSMSISYSPEDIKSAKEFSKNIPNMVALASDELEKLYKEKKVC